VADLVNLRQARKRKHRAEAQSKADANRALHGRGAAEKKAGSLVRDLEGKRLDAHRREPTPASGEPD
jgi:hypothetical protein